jgi:APA family basic amino acid/polyamine antiporter
VICNESNNPVARTRLGRAIGRGGYFTLAFGAVIGSGWVVVMGDWLRSAGPGGTAVGFLAGGVVMILVALCYGELASHFSTAGGEFLYTLETLGARAGFLVGWFLTLYAVSVCAFEAIAGAWLLQELIPGINLGSAYSVAGVPVGRDALLVGGIGTLAIGTLHYRGARSAILFQNIVTYGFIAVSVLLIAWGVIRGSPHNARPFWSAGSGGPWAGGAFWIFATCAFFLNGWQTAVHAIEERRSNVSPRGAVLSMAIAIAAATTFYVGIVLAAAFAAPWRTLIGQDLPAAAAFRSLGLHGLLGTVILAAATASLLKTWSAMTWIASRVIYAQARHKLLPEVFARVDPRTGAPRAAIVLVMALTLMGVAIGRGAILPIVDMVSISIALSIILCLLVLLRRRRLDTVAPSFTVPGGALTIGAAFVGAAIMIGGALFGPLVTQWPRVPIEWILLAAWAVLGIGLLRWAPGLREVARLR